MLVPCVSDLKFRVPGKRVSQNVVTAKIFGILRGKSRYVKTVIANRRFLQNSRFSSPPLFSFSSGRCNRTTCLLFGRWYSIWIISWPNQANVTRAQLCRELSAFIPHWQPIHDYSYSRFARRSKWYYALFCVRDVVRQQGGSDESALAAIDSRRNTEISR